jgi:multidrug efflux pump subunit AcrA (membrane-fusion protein)
MRPGMYAEVRFMSGQAQNRLAVPTAAVRSEQARYYLFVVEPDTQEVPVESAQAAMQEERSLLTRMAEVVEGYRRRFFGGEEAEVPMKEVEVLTVRRLSVKLGQRGEGFVEVNADGLTPESRVVDNPADDLRSGQKVQIVDDGEAGN